MENNKVSYMSKFLEENLNSIIKYYNTNYSSEPLDFKSLSDKKYQENYLLSCIDFQNKQINIFEYYKLTQNKLNEGKALYHFCDALERNFKFNFVDYDGKMIFDKSNDLKPLSLENISQEKHK